MIIKILFLVFILFPNISFAQNSNWNLGPIELGNQHTLALNHTSITPMSPMVLKQKEFKLDIIASNSNTFNYEKNNYLIDSEDAVLDFNLAYGFSNNLQVGIKNQLRSRGSGFFDNTIEQWHEFFNLPKGKRDKIEHNSFSISGKNDDQSEFEIIEKGTSFSDIEVYSKYLISSGTEDSPAVSLFLSSRIPTTKENFGQNSTDINLGVIFAKSFNNYYLYSGLNYLYFFDSEMQNLSYEQKQYGGYLALEYSWNANLSLNIALIGASSLLDSVSQFPNYQIYLDTGVKYRFNHTCISQFLIRENPSPGDGTTDFTVSLGLTYLY